MTSTAVTRYIEAPLGERHEYARALASAGDLIPTGLWSKPRPDGQGGIVPAAPSVGKVLLVLETGAMLGIHPVAALSGIHVIEGKPAISAALISAVIRAAGHRLRVTTSGTIEAGDYQATATLVRSDDPDFTFSSTWTPARAARAGLAGKNVWKNYPEAMCKARAISEVGREGAEDALLGVHYTPEELDAPVDSNGELVGEVVEAEEAPKKRRAPAVGTQGTKRAAQRLQESMQAQEEPQDAEVIEEPTEPPTSESEVQAVIDKANRVIRDTAEEAGAVYVPAEDRERVLASPESIDEHLARTKAEREKALADAEERERAEREAIAAEQEAKARAEEAAYIAQQEEEARAAFAATEAKPEPEEERFLPTDPAVRAQRWEEAVNAHNWGPALDYSDTIPQLKNVWAAAEAARELTTPLRAAIARRKEWLDHVAAGGED